MQLLTTENNRVYLKMHPILFRIGGFTLYSYGLMLLLAFLVGIYMTERRAAKIGIDPKKVSDLGLWILIGAVVGSRLLYVALHWGEFSSDPIEIIAFWRGGLAGLMLFGGFLGGFLAGLLYVKKQKLPLLKMMDLVAPALAFGLFLVRIGCFLNGCCFGKPFSLGIVFPSYCAAGYTFPGIRIHPTQLYTSLAGLIIFFILLKIEKRKPRLGALFGAYLILHAGFRFGIDFIRYYENAANLWTNQIIALALVAVGIMLVLRRVAKGKR